MSGLSYLHGAAAESDFAAARRANELEAIATRVQRKVDALNAEIATLHQQLQHRDRIIEDQQDKLNQQSAEIVRQQAEIDSGAGTIEDFRTTMITQDFLIDEMEREITRFNASMQGEVQDVILHLDPNESALAAYVADFLRNRSEMDINVTTSNQARHRFAALFGIAVRKELNREVRRPGEDRRLDEESYRRCAEEAMRQTVEWAQERKAESEAALTKNETPQERLARIMRERAAKNAGQGATG